MESPADHAEPGPAQNGTGKGSAPSEADGPPLRLRLLVPHALVPLLIGKKGENVKRIRRESGATVSVADPVLGCDERVVHITGESLDAEDSTAAADALLGVFDSICFLQQRKAESLAAAATAVVTPLPSPPALSPPACSEEEGSLTEVDVGTAAVAMAATGLANGSAARSGSGGSGSGSGSGMASSSASVGEPLSSGPGSVAGSTASARGVEARLLVDSALVGYLVGRGGATIKDTIARSGAAVRILPKAELPACACIGDEVVRVSGEAGLVGAALRLLAGQIKAHPLRLGALSHDGASSSGGGGSSFGGGPQLVGGLQPPPLMLAQASHPDLAFMHPALGGGSGFFPAGAPASIAAFCGTAVEVTFRLLAPATRTGNIIGKGGEHVKRVRTETGARIKVFDPAPSSEERVVALTSSEDALSPYCAAQDALIRCVIALTADDAPNSSHRVRLLTAQASVGIVLGKRGATVSQLRQETGASIKVLPAELVPPAYGGGLGPGGESESEVEMGSISSGGGMSSGMSTGGPGSGGGGGEEVIQVEGSVQQCVAALRGVATLLRGWQIRRLLALQQQQHFGGGGGMLVQMHAAPMPAGVPMSPTASGPMGGAGPMSPSSPGIMLPSTLVSPVQPQYAMAGHHHHHMVGGPPLMGPPPQPGVQRPNCSYVYHLSNAQVGAVLGKGGSHIVQIRQMSGARVQLQGEIEGGGRVMTVAGQPEQCHTAHSMTNAFLGMGRCEPAFPEPMLG